MATDLIIAVLGLGEAGSHFANDLAALGLTVVGYDPNPQRALHPAVRLANSNAEAARGADIILSVNLSAVAEAVAAEVLPVLAPNQLYAELNTASPGTKRAVATILQPSGVGVVDVAIMAPVPPKGILTPFLIAGPGAALFHEKLAPWGLDISVLSDEVGEAATRKLLRSIVYKGVAAVIGEAVAAGQSFGLEPYIREQIRSVIGGNDALIDRFLEGSKTHALRRSHEIEAVVSMLTDHAVEPVMSRATLQSLKNLIPVSESAVPKASVNSSGRAIPCLQFRGGSSKGLFFDARHLPTDEADRDRVLLAAMEGVGPGDPRQIDGLGGANSLTSKIAIVSPSTQPGIDLDYLFAQVVVGEGRVSLGQSCGNMLAAVLPFAIESGMLPASEPTTTARINLVNTGGSCEVIVQTPGGHVRYASGPDVGYARVDGVPGTAAPIVCHYLDTAGSTCGALLPTGHRLDVVEGIALTCIDNGMPVVLLRATDLGITGYETKAELEANEALKTQLERIRLAIGPRMNLGDVSQKTVPKLCLIALPQHGGVVSTRMFIPHVVHEAIGVLAAVSVATACALPGTVADGVAVLPPEGTRFLSVEHPSGEFTVSLEITERDGQLEMGKSGVIRTARLLSRGEVLIPAS